MIPTPVLRKKKEKIQGTLILFPGSPAILDVSYRGIHGSASLGEVQYAQNQPLTEERIRSQMEKLGNTEYEWENLEIQMDESIFIPMKMLNEVRRQALESLEEEILKSYRREEVEKNSQHTNKKADKIQKTLPIYISCEEKSTALALYKREGIQGMYLNGDAMEACLDEGVSRGMEMYLSLPHIMRGEFPENLLAQIDNWLDRGMTGFLVRNLETFAILKKAGLAEKCVLDHSMYTWNDEAVDFWIGQHAMRNTVPLELNEGEIRHRDNQNSEMLIYGYLPLMISAQCVHKNVYGCNHKEEWVTMKDRYDKEFTAKCVCNPWKMENTNSRIPCYNIIYNSIPYGLLKEKSQIDRLGVSSLRLAFTIEKPQDAVKIYEEFRDVYLNEKNPPKRDYTKGHFKRGAE
jgi:U32 family peptidase